LQQHHQALLKAKYCPWVANQSQQWFMSYQQCTRFRTTLDFNREYPWNGLSNHQAENGDMNYDFSTFDENNSMEAIS